jgi:hypothetical protein
MKKHLAPDPEIYLLFMRAVRRRGPWTFHAIHPDRVQLSALQAATKGIELDAHVQRIPTKTFSPASEKEMIAWIAIWNVTHGIYFAANPSRRHAFGRRASEFMRKDAETLDLAAFQYAAIDLDPPKGITPEEWEKHVRQKFAELDLQPTFLWRSGYGMQAMWGVKPAVNLLTNEDVRQCKRTCKGVAEMVSEKLGLTSDSVASLDHIFRLAGTINYPNKNKRALGRVAVVAGDFTFDPACVYGIERLPKAADRPRPVTAGLVEPPGGWDADENVAIAIMHCRHTRDLAGEGKSRTAWRTALHLRDLGVSVEKAFELMWQIWAPRCEYQWDCTELRDKIERAYARAENDPGCKTVAYRVARARQEFGE